jgi:shikimate kinase/3-dehydroquinate synthase
MSGWIFLSGMMGTGKSTVARQLAAQLGVEPVDLDARIAARAGTSIPEIFRAEGEEAFRRLEAEEARALLDEGRPTVVALGGGTVTRDDTRRMLLRHGTLITLSAPAEELARRLAGTTGRPLLESGESAQILADLLEERAAVYAECHAEVRTEGRDPAAVAREVLAVARRRPIVVPLGRRTYRVEIGAGVLATLGSRLQRHVPGAVVLVTDENVHRPWAARAIEHAEEAGRKVVPVVLTPGEAHKTIAAVEAIWDAALDAGVDRRAGVLAVAGGVPGDLAGFAAATLLRGVRFAQVPTSLLAMVDSSVGGKTGFDRPQGKNLVGAFHQPEFVLVDVDTLATLPDEEMSAGLAEVLKAAWLESEEAVAGLERDAAALRAKEPAAVERAIRMAVQLKADVVAEDEREAGTRMVLNLGHTIGHAIEAASDFTIRHGEAVGLGLLAAFRIAAGLGDPDAPLHERRCERLLRAFGLPTDLDRHLDERTLAFVGADKKRAAGKVRFVVPGPPGRVERVPLTPERIRALLG